MGARAINRAPQVLPQIPLPILPHSVHCLVERFSFWSEGVGAVGASCAGSWTVIKSISSGASAECRRAHFNPYADVEKEFGWKPQQRCESIFSLLKYFV